MEANKRIKTPTIRIPLVGVQRLKRIFEVLNLTFDWKLQPRDFSIVAEIYNENQVLINKGISDESIRMSHLLSKDYKDKLGVKYDMIKQNRNIRNVEISSLRKNGWMREQL